MNWRMLSESTHDVVCDEFLPYFISGIGSGVVFLYIVQEPAPTVFVGDGKHVPELMKQDAFIGGPSPDIRAEDDGGFSGNPIAVHADDGLSAQIVEFRCGGDELVPSEEALNDRVFLSDAVSPCDGHKFNTLRVIGGPHVCIEFPKDFFIKLGHMASLLRKKG